MLASILSILKGSAMRTAPPLRSIVAVVVLAFVIITGALVLYALTPVSNRPDAWQAVASAGTAIAVAVPSLLAWLSASSADASATSAAKALNGGFEARVSGIVTNALTSAGLAPTTGTVPTTPALVPAPAPVLTSTIANPAATAPIDTPVAIPVPVSAPAPVVSQADIVAALQSLLTGAAPVAQPVPPAPVAPVQALPGQAAQAPVTNG